MHTFVAMLGHGIVQWEHNLATAWLRAGSAPPTSFRVFASDSLTDSSREGPLLGNEAQEEIMRSPLLPRARLLLEIAVRGELLRGRFSQGDWERQL